jgi:Amt family ammonium transporter
LLDIDNVGIVAANAAVSTVLAGSTAGVSALFTNYFIQERRTGEPAFDLVKCMNGSLAGLVASSSGCVLLEPWAMAIVGIIAGWLYLWSSDLLIRYRIDDCVDAIPVHLFNGAWGMMAVGLFASPTMMEAIYNIDHVAGLVYVASGFDVSLLANQALAILFILAWTFVAVLPFFMLLNYVNWFRSESLEEIIGLDVSYHGTSATQDEDKESIKKEYLEASQRDKVKQRRRRSRSSVDGESTMSDSRGIVYDSSNFGSRFSDLESIQEGAAKDTTRGLEQRRG